MIRRLLSVLAVCVFAVSIAACDSSGSDDPSGDTTKDVAAHEATSSPDSEPTDNSVSDTAVPDVVVPDTAVEDQAVPKEVEHDAAGQCNNLVPDGAIISQVEIGQEAPVLGGGTIVDGTYVLTKWEKYVGTAQAPEPSTQMRRDVIVIDQGVVEFALEFPGVVFKTYSFNYTTNGNELMISQTCPEQKDASPTYEATETTFTWLNGKELTYFTKM